MDNDCYCSLNQPGSTKAFVEVELTTRRCEKNKNNAKKLTILDCTA